MNIKLIALAVCLGYGIWFAAIGGRQLAPEDVAEIYRQYTAAFDRGDGKAVCDLFADEVSGKFTSTSRSMPVDEVLSKASACSSVDDFYRTKKQLENATGQELYTNFEYTIKSVAISPDKKTASVEVLIEMRIGTEQQALLDRRSTQTDIIKRRFGKSRFVQSDGSVSFYK